MADNENTELRSQMYKHEDIAEWLTEQGHINAESTQAEVIAAAFAKRNEYRKTDRYAELVAAGDPAAAEREAAKAEKAKERAEAKAAKAAEREAAKAEKAAAKAAKDEPEKATKPAKASRSKKAAAAAENPFD